VSTPWIVVTGLDGSGKTHVVEWLAGATRAKPFRLPYHDFVRACLARSGDGSQFGDVHTDRLLFALDGRLANYQIRQWRLEGVRLVSQRGWTDNFVFGAVQGITYEETEELLRSYELERASAYVHLIAEPKAAFERIKNDPDHDKYETADFLIPQFKETVRLFDEVTNKNPVLREFHDIPAVMIDTTMKTNGEVYEEVRQFIAKAIPTLELAPTAAAGS
jgi:thymidylate kinase